MPESVKAGCLLFSLRLVNAPRTTNLNSIVTFLIASIKACSDYNNVDGESGRLQMLYFVVLIVIQTPRQPTDWTRHGEPPSIRPGYGTYKSRFGPAYAFLSISCDNMTHD